ncbi:MAG: amidohydrolase family protein [Lachnospiraceae bacterium]|nr:amidohydrolase family protein [Lachnospiraceae bacterium]
MSVMILKGCICWSLNPDQLETVENGFLVVENGLVEGVYRELPEKFRTLPVTDYTDKLILPGMTDLHIHAPQFPYRGLGMDLELLAWLEAYAFPEEAKYADIEYADRAYEIFTEHLLHSETTRASIFATLHVPATLLLMDKLEKTGLITYVGKVNMDRNSPEILTESSAQKSAKATEQWIRQVRERGYQRTKPILTPRFTPSCSDELMYRLRDLQLQYDLPLQSHLSENRGEVAWVKELCPDTSFYGEAYEQFGLFGGDHPCIMAHCVYSSEEEEELMKKNGVFIAHSPESNMNVASGIAPISRYLDHGLKVGLATDVAGGSHESMFRAMQHALQASKLRWRLVDETIRPLTFERAFYIATMGGGEFFGKVGSFMPGYAFDALVMDDANLKHPQPLTVRERLERLIYLADRTNLQAKYADGKKILG